VSDIWHTILSPSQRAGAIGLIMVHHPAPGSIGIEHPGVHRLKLVDLLGIDEGVVLGLDTETLILMPHGGVAIMRALSARLNALGLPVRDRIDPQRLYPEASGEIEAWCMHALSIAPSPMAVDVLLEHNARWAGLDISTTDGCSGVESAENASLLDRLIYPPTVAAVGRANVGKSSLINALVGQQVALVADVAGTTRDHVGVPVDLGGLVVRWVDTPGVDERIGDRAELAIVRSVLAHADLVVHCIDAIDDPGVLDPRLASVIPDRTPIMRVGTRADLGEHGCACDLRVSLGDSASGVAQLVSALCERLMPRAVLDDPRPWRFWASLGDGA
jgi:tRNA modification GTPase